MLFAFQAVYCIFMSKLTPKNIIIAVLLGVSVASVFKLMSYLKERKDTESAMFEAQEQAGAYHKQAQNLLQDLEKQKTGQERLTQENEALKNYLRASKKRIGKLFVENRQIGEKLASSDERLAVVKAENAALVQQEALYAQENTALKKRLSSLDELKKAIREVKLKMREAHRRISEEVRRDIELVGNRGFLTRGGKSTFSSLVRIEVTPTSGM